MKLIQVGNRLEQVLTMTPNGGGGSYWVAVPKVWANFAVPQPDGKRYVAFEIQDSGVLVLKHLPRPE